MLINEAKHEMKMAYKYSCVSLKGDGRLMQINILFVHRGCHVSRLLFPPKHKSLTPAGLLLFLVYKRLLGVVNSAKSDKNRL